MNAPQWLWLPQVVAHRIRRGLPRLGVVWIVGGLLFGGMTVWWASVLNAPDSANAGFMAGFGVVPPLCLSLTGAMLLPIGRCVRDGRLHLGAARRVRARVISCAVACGLAAAVLAAVMAMLTWEYLNVFSALFPSAMAPALLCLPGAIGAVSMLPPSAKVIRQYS